MTTTQSTETGHHPFTAALAAQDIDALVGTLAPDAVLHSAVTNTPFEGREVVADVYRSVFEAFDELQVTDRFQDGDTHAFFWEGRVDGRFVAGADRFRVDDAGQVREITIVGRPLTGLAGFITGSGLPFRPPAPRPGGREDPEGDGATARADVLAGRPDRRLADPREALGLSRAPELPIFCLQKTRKVI